MKNLLIAILLWSTAQAQQPLKDTAKIGSWPDSATKKFALTIGDSTTYKEIVSVIISSSGDTVISVSDSAKAIRYMAIEMLRWNEQRKRVNAVLAAYQEFMRRLGEDPVDKAKLEEALEGINSTSKEYYK